MCAQWNGLKHCSEQQRNTGSEADQRIQALVSKADERPQKGSQEPKANKENQRK